MTSCGNKLGSLTGTTHEVYGNVKHVNLWNGVCRSMALAYTSMCMETFDLDCTVTLVDQATAWYGVVKHLRVISDTSPGWLINFPGCPRLSDCPLHLFLFQQSHNGRTWSLCSSLLFCSSFLFLVGDLYLRLTWLSKFCYFYADKVCPQIGLCD